MVALALLVSANGFFRQPAEAPAEPCLGHSTALAETFGFTDRIQHNDGKQTLSAALRAAATNRPRAPSGLLRRSSARVATAVWRDFNTSFIQILIEQKIDGADFDDSNQQIEKARRDPCSGFSGLW